MEHARSGLQKVVLDAIRRAPPEQAPLLAWPVACGPKASEHTHALDFAHGVLRVQVPDEEWRTQVQALRAEYMVVLRQFGVTGIEFVIAAGAGR